MTEQITLDREVPLADTGRESASHKEQMEEYITKLNLAVGQIQEALDKLHEERFELQKKGLTTGECYQALQSQIEEKRHQFREASRKVQAPPV